METQTQTQFQSRIFRYKLSDETINGLSMFAKVHQLDDRKTFKAAWQTWIEENEDLVTREERHHKENKYEGDVMDKMFKSARYYYRKKGTAKKAPTQEEDKITKKNQMLPKDLLRNMDSHICESMKRGDFKPSDGFTDFYENNQEEIGKVIKMEDEKAYERKIKKTYKNRYFMMIKNEK